MQINYCSIEICFYIYNSGSLQKADFRFYIIEPLGEKFYPGGFLFAKNSKNYVKTVVKRKPVSLLICKDYFIVEFFCNF